MKVKFIDGHHAVLTKGWLKKYTANVRRSCAGDSWRYEAIDEKVESSVDRFLDIKARNYAKYLTQQKKSTAWRPVVGLPKAAVIKS